MRVRRTGRNTRCGVGATAGAVSLVHVWQRSYNRYPNHTDTATSYLSRGPTDHELDIAAHLAHSPAVLVLCGVVEADLFVVVDRLTGEIETESRGADR